MLKKFIASLVLVLALPTLVQAASPSHRQAAEELMIAAGVRESISKMIDQMVSLQVSRNPQMQPYEHVFRGFFKKYLGYDSVKHELVQIYTEEFTESELNQIIEFYRTPVGQKTVNKMPVLTQKGMQVSVAKMKTHAKELEKMLEEAVKKQSEQSGQQQAPAK